MSKQKSKTDAVRKGKVINLRVTESEFSAINTLCDKAKITRSAYILQAVLNEKILTNIDAQVVFQLQKIGNNINQITKQVHIISKFIEKKEQSLPDILDELSSMNEQIEAIKNFILKDHVDKNRRIHNR